MAPPLGLTRKSGKRREAPHLEVLESQGLIRAGGTLCRSGEGDYQDPTGPGWNSSPSYAESTARPVLPSPRASRRQRAPEDTSLQFDDPV